MQQFVEAPRLAAHEDARLRQGVVEQITSGSGQCPFVGMQAVEQGGRFDVGARLPQPLRAREEQRLLLHSASSPSVAVSITSAATTTVGSTAPSRYVVCSFIYSLQRFTP